MRYSVYDYANRNWRYYEAGGTVPPTGWFRKGTGEPVPERLIAALPPDAVETGIGDLPQGVIATPRQGGALAGLGEDGPPSAPASLLQWVGLAVVAGLAFYAGRRSVEVERKARAALGAARSVL